MKAVICTAYGPPEVLRVAEVAKPVPGKGEICIRVRSTAVTASDCIIRRGQARFPMWLFMRAMLGFTKPRRIPGGVLSGEVESVGRGVTRFKEGDAVFGMTGLAFGAYAEYACMKETARFAALATKPANVSHEEAAAVPYGGLLALCFLKPAGVATARRILVYGASGSIGTAAVQIARHFGAEVTGVCGPANVDLVRSLGAAKVIDYTKQDSIPEGERYDLVFDAVGKRKTSKLKDACRTAILPEGKSVSVDDRVAKLDPSSLELLRDLMKSGKLRAVIDRRYPLDEIVEAQRYVEQGHKRGNVVVAVA
ncbi:MAG TPA: NAD(P)-dependent alcohol dehydrogenase [Thermoanaerobaculia bacterium]|nr:NAD(P)-dependent alcohol dehydrogenase [Thermoanaerobaculia bacterium]